MEYRRIGKSGLKTSVVALGNWLTYGTKTEMDAARACVRIAYDLGVNHFDSANVYGSKPHEGEQVLGEMLRDYPRHSYILTSKAFWPVGDGPNDRGLSRKHLFDQIDLSLRALGTDYLDIYYCHRYDPETDVEETLRALDDLVASGKVRYAAVSEWQAHQIVDAAHIGQRLGLRKLLGTQSRYNMLQRMVESNGVQEVLQREGQALIPFSPLAQGLLTGKYQPGQAAPAGSRGADPKQNRWINAILEEPANVHRLERLLRVAADVGIPLGHLALAWLLEQPTVPCVLVGATRPEQMEMNVQAAKIQLTSDLRQAIAEALV